MSYRTQNRKKMIKDEIIKEERAELQCMESCLAKGFSFEMYIDCKTQLIEMLQESSEDNEDEL